MNLDIMEYSEETGEVFWRLNGEDGVCEVDEAGKIDSVYLCDGPFDMKPDALKQVCKEVQAWLDEKPKRDADNKAWQDRFDYYFGQDGVWAEWMNQNDTVRHAIASVYHEPSEYTGLGEVRFVMYGDDYWGDGDTVYRSQLYNNPTWGDVMREFDMAIDHCKDFHHCFLEGIEEDPNHPGEINFLTGS